MGLTYKEIKSLTQDEEVFLIESYNHLNDLRYGKKSGGSGKKFVKAKKDHSYDAERRRLALEAQKERSLK